MHVRRHVVEVVGIIEDVGRSVEKVVLGGFEEMIRSPKRVAM